nr:serine hydrolase [Bacillus marinisedimentorum]
MLSIVFGSAAPAKAAGELELSAESAILVDAASGKILYEKDADKPLPPASMTKMMTEYLVRDAIEKNQIEWDQKTSISQYAHEISQNTDLSNVPLRIEEKYSVRELYEAMAIYSANGATIALAELVAGSESNFVKMMNEKGKEMDLGDFKFVNTTGLNNSDLLGNHPEGTRPDEETMITARGTAKLAYHLIKDYPDVIEIASIPIKKFRDGTDDMTKMDNWNWMIPGSIEPQFDYEGVDGIKTGSTSLAGYSFTSTAKRDGMRLISVVMKTSSYSERFTQTKKLLDYGFSGFDSKELFPAGYQIKGKSEVPVVKGKENNVKVEAEKALTSVIRKGEDDKYSAEYALNEDKLTEEGELTAPLEEGEKVGKVVLKYSGENDYGYLTKKGSANESVPLVTTESVEKANWFALAMRGVGGFFGDIWSSAADTVKGWF